MDRDEALRLLKGGPEGVAEWNRRRKAGEGISDLRKADLERGQTSAGPIWPWAIMLGTVFADVDLSEVKELDSVRHRGPSTSASTRSSARGEDLRGVPAGLRRAGHLD